MTVFIASDHGGWRQKKRLVRWLRTKGLDIRDIGPSAYQAQDDYPIWAARVAGLVQRQPRARGILICRSGVGMAIAANKFPGIRATPVFSAAMARQSRQDEDTNILSLAADYHSNTALRALAWSWLRTPFRKQPRHVRRLRQLARLEHAN